MAYISIKKVITFAQQNGYSDAMYRRQWNGFSVYEPVYDDTSDDSIPVIGLPLMILVDGDDIRLTTPDEAFTLLDSMPEED